MRPGWLFSQLFLRSSLICIYQSCNLPGLAPNEGLININNSVMYTRPMPCLPNWRLEEAMPALTPLSGAPVRADMTVYCEQERRVRQLGICIALVTTKITTWTMQAASAWEAVQLLEELKQSDSCAKRSSRVEKRKYGT